MQNLVRYHPRTNQCPHHPPFYLLGVLKAYTASTELKRRTHASRRPISIRKRACSVPREKYFTRNTDVHTFLLFDSRREKKSVDIFILAGIKSVHIFHFAVVEVLIATHSAHSSGHDRS